MTVYDGWWKRARCPRPSLVYPPGASPDKNGRGCWALGVGCWLLGVGCWESEPNPPTPFPGSFAPLTGKGEPAFDSRFGLVVVLVLESLPGIVDGRDSRSYLLLLLFLDGFRG